MNCSEHAFYLLEQKGDILSSKDFSHKGASFFKEKDRDVECSQDQLMLHELIEVVVSEDVRGAIADDKVYALLGAEDTLDLLNAPLTGDVPLD